MSPAEIGDLYRRIFNIPETVAPNFSGPSNDQYSGAPWPTDHNWTPFSPLPPRPPTTSVSASEDGGYTWEQDGTVAPNFSGPSSSQYSGQWSPLGPLPQLQPTTSVRASEEGGYTWGGTPQSYGNIYGYGDGLSSSFPLSPNYSGWGGLSQSDLDRLGQLPQLPQYSTPDRTMNTVANIGSKALGPWGSILNALYGFGTGAITGERLPSDPNASTLQSLFDPREPGLVQSGANYVGRQLYDLFGGGTSSVEQGSTSQDLVYNPYTGRMEPSPSSTLQPYGNTNTYDTLAQLQAMGGYSPQDVYNFYDQGGMSMMPAQGGLNFGASRFSTIDHGGAFNPSTYTSGNTSLDQAYGNTGTYDPTGSGWQAGTPSPTQPADTRSIDDQRLSWLNEMATSGQYTPEQMQDIYNFYMGSGTGTYAGGGGDSGGMLDAWGQPASYSGSYDTSNFNNANWGGQPLPLTSVTYDEGALLYGPNYDFTYGNPDDTN
jgi:hypothetical protein